MHDTSRLLVDYVVANDAALVDVDVTMLGDGGLRGAGSTAVVAAQDPRDDEKTDARESERPRARDGGMRSANPVVTGRRIRR